MLKECIEIYMTQVQLYKGFHWYITVKLSEQ